MKKCCGVYASTVKFSISDKREEAKEDTKKYPEHFEKFWQRNETILEPLS